MNGGSPDGLGVGSETLRGQPFTASGYRTAAFAAPRRVIVSAVQDLAQVTGRGSIHLDFVRYPDAIGLFQGDRTPAHSDALEPIREAHRLTCPEVG